MAKKEQAEAEAPALTYHFSNDGSLTGASYSGALDSTSHEAVKAAILDAREVAKGRK